MEPTVALWHIANFFAPAAGVGLIAGALTKWMWRRELTGVGWLRLALGASMAMAAVSMAGLVLFARDGRMVTYAAMVVACALALWWIGFRRRS